MDSQIIAKEVRRLLDLLRSQAVQQRLDAATELKSIGVRTRGAARTRGTVTQSATKPIEEIDLTPAFEALADAHWEIRQQVALAVGEWGDELAIEVLKRLAYTDPEWRVRVAVAEALANIGGPKAIEILKHMAQADPHQDVRARAIEGLGDLALATWPELAEKQREISHPRGVRVRGASPSKRLSPEAEAILELIDELRFRDHSSYVREVADKTLGRLDE